MTLEAWVCPTALGTTGGRSLFKEQPGNLAYGLYANTSASPAERAGLRRRLRPERATARAAPGRTRGPTSRPPTTARTCGSSSTARRSASRRQTGAIATSTGALRIGGNNIWREFFQGRIDEVRVYNRALTPTEIQNDMARRALRRDTDAADRRRRRRPRTAPPGSRSPRRDGHASTRRWIPTSITGSTFELRDSGGALVPATVTYDALAATATLTPTSGPSLRRRRTRPPSRAARPGPRSRHGRQLASRPNVTWSFTLEASPPPILVVDVERGQVQLLPRRDPPRRGPERVHDHRRRRSSRPRCSTTSTSSCSATRRLTPRRSRRSPAG